MEHLTKNPGLLNDIDTLVFDCDGVLWDNKAQVINGSADIISMLQDAGKRVFFITNNSGKTRQQYAERCKNLGFKVSEENIVCTAWLVATYLRDVLNHQGKTYLIGNPAIEAEMKKKDLDVVGTGVESYRDELPFPIGHTDIELDPDVNAVVVGLDPYINYTKNVMAASYLQRPGSVFVATNIDSTFPNQGPIRLPGTGATVRFVATAAGREPTTVGKPSLLSKDILEAVHGKFNCERTMMVGDRLDTDILFGHKCGFKTLFVLSGVNTLTDVEVAERSEESRSCVPDYYIETVGHLKPLLLKK